MDIKKILFASINLCIQLKINTPCNVFVWLVTESVSEATKCFSMILKSPEFPEST